MNPVEEYLKLLQKELTTQNALEHSYRPALKQLIETLNPQITAVNEPTRSQHGAPDFVFLDQKNRDLIFGYAETKDVYVNLDQIEKSEQLKRYYGYPNLILTNYIEFRFFRNGEKYQTITIANKNASVLVPQPISFLQLGYELKAFLEEKPETITNAKKLAAIMGGKAARIRENIKDYLNDKNEENDEILRMYKIMQDTLVHDLSHEKFADMYSQTLVYGLFIARYYDETPESFTRSEARELIPASNPFLQQFFDHIAGVNFVKRLKYIVDELCDVFSVSAVREIVTKHYDMFGAEIDKDPVIHFYEDFLKEYDPELRKDMGAYYTPIPVVQFIIRAVDDVLKKEFDLPQGLADTTKIEHEVMQQGTKSKKTFHRVQLLDPAVGTATFLNETVKFIHEKFKNQQGIWESYVEKELLPRLHGFELMMAPYTIAHLKLAMTFKETGIDKFDHRLGVYLTNTLEEGFKEKPDLFSSLGFAEAISQEARAASVIKHDTPIMVIIGNPPYSASSSNRTKFANNLIQKYKVEPGGSQKLDEKKHWLNDDYVKFMAFAEDMVAKNGNGIVAMITNNGYLENSTFRGMRWHLTKTFDKIYVVNLHGNLKKKEMAPDGSKDENVFDIMQGVAIILAVKTGVNTKDLASVYYSELYGTRKLKFNELNKTPLFKELKLDEKNYFFVKKNLDGLAQYEAGIPLQSLMPSSVTGLVTGKDPVTMFNTYDECRTFIDWCKTATDEQLERKWGKFGRGQTAQKIRNDVNDPRGIVTPVSYRPFETKWTYYSGAACGFLLWPRQKQIMGSLIQGDSESVQKDMSFSPDSHLKGSDLIGISYERGGLYDKCPVLVNKHIIPNGYSFSNTASIVYTAPLYIREDGLYRPNLDYDKVRDLLSEIEKGSKAENLFPKDIEIFDYIYATLYSPNYRDKYKEFLKTDFPRIPLAKDKELFWKLVKLGEKLRKLHLMEDPDLSNIITTYPISGNNLVEKVEYRGGRVFINELQFFGDVPQVAWDFYIGGYQPSQKWLKDRKGRKLTYEDINHYQKIIVSLVETDKVMREIDKVN